MDNASNKGIANAINTTDEILDTLKAYGFPITEETNEILGIGCPKGLIIDNIIRPSKTRRIFKINNQRVYLITNFRYRTKYDSSDRICNFVFWNQKTDKMYFLESGNQEDVGTSIDRITADIYCRFPDILESITHPSLVKMATIVGMSDLNHPKMQQNIRLANRRKANGEHSRIPLFISGLDTMADIIVDIDSFIGF